MRVSEKNLNRGWVGTGWWLCRLLLSAFDTTNKNISLLRNARLKHLVLRWVGGWMQRKYIKEAEL